LLRFLFLNQVVEGVLFAEVVENSICVIGSFLLVEFFISRGDFFFNGILQQFLDVLKEGLSVLVGDGRDHRVLDAVIQRHMLGGEPKCPEFSLKESAEVGEEAKIVGVGAEPILVAEHEGALEEFDIGDVLPVE
jgi:hypothetical protein